MGIKIDKYRKIVNKAIMLIIVVFAVQIANNALFYHTHTIDGKNYTHAHPGQSNGHSHSNYELNFYQQLQLLSVKEIPELIAVIIPFYAVKAERDYRSDYLSLFSDNDLGRAPPALI